MQDTYTATSTTTINAPVAKVWEALTNPEIVKQWMFGTDLKSDWLPGSTITYSGMWDGKPYEDKGTVKDIKQNEYIKMNYWSSAFGDDIPENYVDVNYELEGDGEQTKLTISQTSKDADAAKHSEQNWNMVLEGLKKLLETN